MRGSSELFRFPIAGLEWTYRIVSKSPYAHTRPLCRLPPTELPTKRRTARCPCHTFSPNHAAHLVSDPLSATRYPPWPRVEGLDRGATRHLPIARSRVLPLGREAIITIAHQYPLWAQATACMIQSKMLRSISLGSGRAVLYHYISCTVILLARSICSIFMCFVLGPQNSIRNRPEANVRGLRF